MYSITTITATYTATYAAGGDLLRLEGVAGGADEVPFAMISGQMTGRKAAALLLLLLLSAAPRDGFARTFSASECARTACIVPTKVA